jgi:glycosyltransferase involved in cell wall biosynthesis
MACGKPVVASYTSGHRDIVNAENALLLKHLCDCTIVGPDRQPLARWQEPSVDELVAQIEYAYHHRDEIRRMGRKAGKDLEGFTWKHSAERLMELLYRA